MASTTRTFDVAVWHAAQDVTLAQDCARRLTGRGLRVTRVEAEAPAAARAVARAEVAVVGEGASRNLTVLPVFAGIGPDLTLLAPGLLAPGGVSICRALPGEAWDLSGSWTDAGAWDAAARLLVKVGWTREAEITASSTLTPARLRRLTIRSYDAIAEQFAQCWWEHPPRRELDEFLRRLQRRSRVLDAGCGPGHHARLLGRAGHEVVGADLSAGMLAQARGRRDASAPVSLIRMDVENLLLGTATLDAVWCAAVLLHIPRERVPRVLAGFSRVLRPGGLLGLNFQVGRASELVQRQSDRRFFEYYPDVRPVAAVLDRAGFAVDAALPGTSTRNTHGLDLTLRWVTLYATRRPA